jgi:hypothetical protein
MPALMKTFQGFCRGGAFFCVGVSVKGGGAGGVSTAVGASDLVARFSANVIELFKQLFKAVALELGTPAHN